MPLIVGFAAISIVRVAPQPCSATQDPAQRRGAPGQEPPGVCGQSPVRGASWWPSISSHISCPFPADHKTRFQVSFTLGDTLGLTALIRPVRSPVFSV